MDLTAQWQPRLYSEADGYARLALENISREFPTYLPVLMNAPGDAPYRPRDWTPVFFGSFDWHSCVEMHWVLIRLLKMAGDVVPADEIRAALDRQFTADGLRAEARYMATRGGWQRPYGWGWALTLAHELATWDDPDARRWTAAMEPLASVLAGNFLSWLPKETYPIRVGLHANSSFGLSRALGYARGQAGLAHPELAHPELAHPELASAIEDAAQRWYAADADYPGGWEPSGHDFLSPALAEAELMTQLMPAEEFARWLGAFLPGLASGEPASLFTPAVVSDSSDGQMAHLHGLNLSRAWCWRRLAETLPVGDPRIAPCVAASQRHAEASLPHVTGDDYMVGHWLAAYAVLLLT
jgi:hypothetical protein